jgi:hypothetical protein
MGAFHLLYRIFVFHFLPPLKKISGNTIGLKAPLRDLVLGQKYCARRAFFRALAAGDAFERKRVVLVLEHGFFGAKSYAGKAADAFGLVYDYYSRLVSAYGLGGADVDADAALGAGDDAFILFRGVFRDSQAGPPDLLSFKKNDGAGVFAFVAGGA